MGASMSGYLIDSAFGKVMGWVTGHPRDADEAKAKFASGADGWLVAHAMTRGETVITNEQPRPDSRSQVKLPDVCRACAMDFQDTFPMLRKLDIHFRFAPTRDGCRPH